MKNYFFLLALLAPGAVLCEIPESSRDPYYLGGRLCRAARDGRIEEVEELLRYVNPNNASWDCSISPNTPSHESSDWGHLYYPNATVWHYAAPEVIPTLLSHPDVDPRKELPTGESIFSLVMRRTINGCKSPGLETRTQRQKNEVVCEKYRNAILAFYRSEAFPRGLNEKEVDEVVINVLEAHGLIRNNLRTEC